MSLRDEYLKGLEAFEKKDYEEAKARFLKAIEEGGQNFPDILNKLALILSFEGKREEAVQYLKRALEINPKYSEAAVNLAYLLNELGQYEEAMEIKRKLHCLFDERSKKNIDPFVLGKIANMHSEIAERYVEIGYINDAIEELKKAIKLRPNFIDIRTRIAVLYREIGEIDEAIDHLTHSILENPNYIPAYIQLGLTYYVMGEKELAQKQWEKALLLDPNNAVAKVYINMLKKKENE
ncbi:MAG: tetratricopeptide repeat protein [Proteobacteria bacterium]|nr:tetratricopeptide repeat protein [Pseudomonadota bacterium]